MKNIAILTILGQDRTIIPYRKQLRPLAKSILSTILLSQIIYWWEKNKFQPFYKYKLPPAKQTEDETDEQYQERIKFYREGDSWCEELGCTKDEFDAAIGNIAHKKDTQTCSATPSIKDCICYYTVRDRRTFYNITDPELLSQIISDYLKSDIPCLAKSTASLNRNSMFSKEEKSDLAKSKSPISNITENTTETTSESCSKEQQSPEGDGECFVKRRHQEEDPDLSYSAKEVLACWNDVEVHGHKLMQHRGHNKTYERIKLAVDSIIDGTFFANKHRLLDGQRSRSLRLAEICSAIERFALSALSDEYFPVDKKYIKKTPLLSFFYNEHSTSDNLKQISPLLYYVDNPPLKVHEVSITDQDDPEVKFIADQFRKLANMNGEPFTRKQYSDFKRCKDKLETYTKDVIHNMHRPEYWRTIYHAPTNVSLMAIHLMDAIKEELKSSSFEVNSGWLCSDRSLKERLPKYLKERRFILQ